MRRVDQAVTAAHQYIVDTSQRTGAWWARQTCVLLAIASVAHWHLEGSSFWKMALMLALAVVAYGLTAFSAVFYRSDTFADVMRQVWLVLTVIDCVQLVMGKHQPALLTLSFCITAYQYFATCKPPRPRPPVTKMATQGGAA